MLFGMAALTEEIQRAFAIIKYGSQNLQRLTNPDKQKLDIVYHIREGSSQADGTSDKVINGAVSVLREAIGRMTGRQALCAVIALVLACGTVSWKIADEYWSTQRETTSAQIALSKASTDAVLQAQQNTLEILRTGQTSTSREILAHGEDGKNKLLKQLAQDPTVTTVSLGEKIVNRDQLNTHSQRQSIDRNKITKEDDFYIKGVTRTGPVNQDISITVTRASNNDTFIIKTTTEMTSTDELKEFTDAVAQENILTINYVEVTENNHVSAGQLISVIHKKED
ncbi:hypothetical protein EAE89_12285 [Photorhabdus heterorhabditis]|nr:hypothetical protein [Photorhabdus heterorhabditis]